MIQIDYREPRKMDGLLAGYNIQIRRMSLGCGDYIVNKRIVERKSWIDFCASYKSGRLLRQVSKLSSHQEPFLIIEGAKLEYLKKLEFFYKVQILIMLYYKLRIVHTNNVEHSAAFLTALYRAPFTKMAINDINTPNIKVSSRERKRRILQCLPYIGKRKTKRIMEKYPRLIDFFSGSKQDLKEIGIGRKTRSAIREIMQ
jgi:ERCC4-type nuclease